MPDFQRSATNVVWPEMYDALVRQRSLITGQDVSAELGRLGKSGALGRAYPFPCVLLARANLASVGSFKIGDEAFPDICVPPWLVAYPLFRVE